MECHGGRLMECHEDRPRRTGTSNVPNVTDSRCAMQRHLMTLIWVVGGERRVDTAGAHRAVDTPIFDARGSRLVNEWAGGAA